MASKVYKIIFFILGIGTLGYMVYALGPEAIWENIQKTGWWFIPVLLSWLVIYLMNAFAFRDIIREEDKPETHLSFGKIFQLTLTGYSINYITPFVALGGEPYRIMELKAYMGGSKAGSSVLLYTMMHILSHIIFWVASVGLILWFVPTGTAMIVACVSIILMAVFGVWWFRKAYKKGITTSSMRGLSKLPFFGKKIATFAEKQEKLLSDIDYQVRSLYGTRRNKFYSALAWEFFARVVGCAEIYFIARALGLPMTYIEALIVSSGSSLFANVIFFFPMQLGTREGGMAVAVASVGYQASLGVFIGIATRIRELVWIAIGLLMMSFSKRNKKNNASAGLGNLPDSSP